MLAALLVLIALARCGAARPNYKNLKPHAPATWQAQLEAGLNTPPPDPPSLAKWWTTLGAPILARLEEGAVAGNSHLKDAPVRVREARALRGVEKGETLPILDATGSAARQTTSGNTGPARRSRLYTAGFDACLESDIFAANAVPFR